MVLWFHVKNQKNGKGKNPLETLKYQAISDPFWIDLRCREKKSKKSVCPAPEEALFWHYRKDTLPLFLGSFSLTLVTKIFPYSLKTIAEVKTTIFEIYYTESIGTGSKVVRVTFISQHCYQLCRMVMLQDSQVLENLYIKKANTATEMSSLKKICNFYL